MTTFDAGLLKGTVTSPDREITFRETVHGPVLGYATVDGRRVAISTKRSTRGRELLSALAFQDLNTNRVHDARSFFRVDEPARVHVQLVLRRQPRHRDVLERPAADTRAGGRQRAPDATAPAATSGGGSSR